MSMCGVQRLEMERRRREALRRERVRQEAMALLGSAEELLRGVESAEAQVLARLELAERMAEVQELRAREGVDEDALLERAASLVAEVRGTVALAGERAAAWAEERRSLARRLEGLRGQVAVLREQTTKTGEVAGAVGELEDRLLRLDAGAVGGAELDGLAVRLEELRVLHDRVRERRQMVEDLRQVLERLGFRVSEREVEGCAVLDGVMAGGQRAAFALRLDGSVEYKLDRYVGEACEGDLAEIERAMEAHCGARFSPVQVTWRAPRSPAGAARRAAPAASRHSGGRS